MTNPQQNALAEALEPCPFCAGTRGLDYNDTGRSWVSCSLCETEGPVMPSRGEARAAWNRRASNNPAAVEGQGDLRDTILAVLQREIVGGDGGTEENFDFIEGIADALLAVLAPAPGQWQDPYRSERTDAVLTRLASQDTELARESIEVISLLRHEQDRLRDENLTLGARVLELEDADREGV